MLSPCNDGKICPICRQPAPCPMEMEKLSGVALPEREKYEIQENIVATS